MKADHCSRFFHGAHPRPELWVRRRNIERGVVVIGNNGENWSDSEVLNQGEKPLPAILIHCGAEIVEAEKELRGPGNHDAASVLRGRSFIAQYHRKRKVLTVQSEVASAIPATPNQRMRSRFKTTSNARFRAPQ